MGRLLRLQTPQRLVGFWLAQALDPLDSRGPQAILQLGLDGHDGPLRSQPLVLREHSVGTIHHLLSNHAKGPASALSGHRGGR